MPTRSAPRDRDMLHRTVQQLVDDGVIAEPDEWPVYVKAPRRPGEGAGWVIRFAGDERRTVLGANSYLGVSYLESLRP